MDDDKYYYKFYYTCDGQEVEYKIPADVDIWTMGDCLRRFLLASSFLPQTIDEILLDNSEKIC